MQLELPSSKSFAHRYLIAAALSEYPCEVVVDGVTVKGGRAFDDLEVPRNWSDDLQATFGCLRAMRTGARQWPCRESGTTLRLLTPIARILGWRGEFIMEGRLGERPQWPADLWERTPAEKNAAGNVRVFRLPGGISSQFVSGLLMALPLAEGDGVIEIEGRLESAHYVEMTLKVLRESGIEIVRDETNGGRFLVRGGQHFRLSGRVEVPEDPELREFYDIILSNEVCHLPSVDVDAADRPDSIPVLAARAAALEGVTTRFFNCQRLRFKESDRLDGIAAMIVAVGGDAKVERTSAQGECLVVTGRRLSGGVVSTLHDHRLVFAAAILRAFAAGPVVMDDVGCVRKSFPGFLSPKLFLYGPPGSGKTTEGRRIAAEAHRPFVDLDDAIAAEAGKTVPEIFAAEGEVGFRRRESAMLRRVVALPGAVVSLGGGTLLDRGNLELVRTVARETGGEIRVLTAPVEVLWARISRDRTRPLAADRASFDRLLATRSGHYSSIRSEF